MANVIYTAVVIAVVLFSSVGLAYLLKRKGLLNFPVLISITISAIIISLAFPYVCGILLNISSSLPFLVVFLPVIFVLGYLTMIFIFTIFVSSAVSEKAIKKGLERIQNSSLVKSLNTAWETVLHRNQQKRNDVSVETGSVETRVSSEVREEVQSVQPSENVVESSQIEQEIVESLLEQAAVNEETLISDLASNSYEDQEQSLVQPGEDTHGDDIQGKNILEKSVDSEQNIDTMCIETIISETINNIEESRSDGVVVETSQESNFNETSEVFESFDIEPQEIVNEEEPAVIEVLDPVAEAVRSDNVEVMEVEDGQNSADETADTASLIEEIPQEADPIEALDMQTQEDSSSVTSIDEGTSDSIPTEAMSESYIEELIDNALSLSVQADELKEEGLEQGEDMQNIDETTNVSDLTAIEPLASTEKADVESYIDAAFRYKQEGKFEEAIQNYMQVLDGQPDKDLVFWVVLDICVLYRNLGQGELAKDILESYIASYGDIMDPGVKEEIEKYL
ncbi:MAG: hypothetical protein N2484_16035 [Clostridia bacterium]|nr:hypothetical protein [Clostridia bacterium]